MRKRDARMEILIIRGAPMLSGDSIGRNRVARSWQDPMGRVAADGEAGADYASHAEGGGRGYELVTVSPEAWAIIWMKSVDEIIE